MNLHRAGSVLDGGSGNRVAAGRSVRSVLTSVSARGSGYDASPTCGTGGFHCVLIVQACLLVVCLPITFLLPEKGRPEEEQHGITPEVTADGSGAKQHLTVFGPGPLARTARYAGRGQVWSRLVDVASPIRTAGASPSRASTTGPSGPAPPGCPGRGPRLRAVPCAPVGQSPAGLLWNSSAGRNLSADAQRTNAAPGLS